MDNNNNNHNNVIENKFSNNLYRNSINKEDKQSTT